MTVPLFASPAGIAGRPVRTVYVLGAGASAEGGVPLSSQILPVGLELLGALRERGGAPAGDRGGPYLEGLVERHREAFAEVYAFIACCMQGAAGPEELDAGAMPTVDELWALLELARGHHARFGGAPKGADVGRVRRALMMLLYHVLVGCRVSAEEPALRVRFGPGPNPYEAFVRMLGPGDAVIALNYDTLLEAALRAVGRSVDYGVATDRRERPGAEAVLLIKPHGSFNWLYCPTCGTLNDFGCRDVAHVAIELGDEQCPCPDDGTPREYIIVPPSLVKSYTNPHLSQLWSAAAMVLRACERVVFCGVSMADSDIYVKYLMKQATSLNPRLREAPGRLVVVNRSNDDVLPYARIFGRRAVHSVVAPFSNYVERELARPRG